MIDIFSCIPFDLPHLLVEFEVALFSLKNFYSSLKKPTPPATVRFFTSPSTLHKVTSFLVVIDLKTNAT